ncbi:MAG: hypothetical protein H6697_09865 [Myxococcales bacterium]|nr:hypothetical protein [Myxococcales bacterium]
MTRYCRMAAAAVTEATIAGTLCAQLADLRVYGDVAVIPFSGAKPRGLRGVEEITRAELAEWTASLPEATP